MEQFKVTVVLLLLACSSSYVTSKPPKTKPVRKVFNAVMDNGDKVAIKVNEINDIFKLTSRDRSLRQKGYERALLMFDYSGTDSLMVVIMGRIRSRTCFHMKAPISEDEFRTKLDEQTGNDITFLEPISLDGRADAKTGDDAKELLKDIPSVRRMCRRAKLVELSALEEANADLEGASYKTILGLDRNFKIAMEKKEGGPRASPPPKTGNGIITVDSSYNVKGSHGHEKGMGPKGKGPEDGTGGDSERDGMPQRPPPPPGSDGKGPGKGQGHEDGKGSNLGSNGMPQRPPPGSDGKGPGKGQGHEDGRGSNLGSSGMPQRPPHSPRSDGKGPRKGQGHEDGRGSDLGSNSMPKSPPSASDGKGPRKGSEGKGPDENGFKPRRGERGPPGENGNGGRGKGKGEMKN